MLYTCDEITTEKTVDINNYPVTVAEAKRHCHVDQDYNLEDDYIDQLIRSCTREAEGFLGKDIAYTLNEVNLYDYSGIDVEIWEGNFNSLVSIVNDTSTLITPYRTYPYFNKIVFELSETESYTSDPLTIKFYTGWTQPNCPEDIKLAVLLRVKDYFDVHRSSEAGFQIYNSQAFERLLAPYRNSRP